MGGPALAPLAGTIAQVLALGSGIEVVAVPPDTRCPPRVELAQAIAARVPDDLAGWVALVRVEARLEPPVENHIRLELRDAAGTVRLRRELAILDDGCGAAAEGLALIVERFFEKVAWTASVPLPEVEMASEAPAGRRWELQAGAGTRREIALAPALAIDLRVALGKTWLAAAGLVVQATATSDARLLGVELWSLPARLSVRRVLAGRLGALEAGPAVGLAGERAQAAEAATPPRYRVVGTVGAVIAARRPLGPAWAIGLEIEGDVTLPPAAFTVEGQGEVLRPAPFQVTAMLGIAHAISP